MITEENRSESDLKQNSGQALGQTLKPIAKEIRFRCPHCQKLYCCGGDVFEGDSPVFDCAACEASFTLLAETDNYGLFVTKKPEKNLLETCPKCSNLKPQKTDECPSCGVYVSKYVELQKAQSPVLYEMNQLWQSVVSHFDDDQYHQDFLNRCHQKIDRKSVV